MNWGVGGGVWGVGEEGEDEGDEGDEGEIYFYPQFLYPFPFPPSYGLVNEPEFKLSPQRLDLFTEVSVKHKSTIS